MAPLPAPKTDDGPKKVAVTYEGRPGDPTFTRWHGVDFEHGKPVELPEDHPILVKPKGKDGKEGPSLVEGSDWFSFPGKPKKGSAGAKGPNTRAAYFQYAADWIAAARTSGEIKTRWEREGEMRERVDWGSDDQEKLDEIMRPKVERLRKEEGTIRS